MAMPEEIQISGLAVWELRRFRRQLLASSSQQYNRGYIPGIRQSV